MNIAKNSDGMEKELVKKRRLNEESFKKLIINTIHVPIDSGYVTRCYCRRCGNSWEMRAGGIRILRKESPDGTIKTPSEIGDLRDEAQLAKCYFVLEPCFFCKEKDEKVTSEAKLLPENGKTFGWEESFFPNSFIANFNNKINGNKNGDGENN